MAWTCPKTARTPSTTPGELLLRVADGDQDAFARLYDMLSPRAFGLILRVLVDRSQSEEVLQEVFLEIWQSAVALRSEQRVREDRGYSRSHIAERWTACGPHRRAPIVTCERASGISDVAHDGVAEEVELRIEGQRVSEALATLPDPQREAITLAYFGGYSQSEIAALVGAPLGTIKTRMRDGLSRLRVEMGVTS